MSGIRILLDEDVWVGLASALRDAGYNAVSVNELKRKGLSDEDQLSFAIAEKRAILTHNIQDFAPLTVLYYEQGRHHFGVIVVRHFDKGTLIRRTLKLLNSLTSESLANTLRFI